MNVDGNELRWDLTPLVKSPRTSQFGWIANDTVYYKYIYNNIY